MEERLIRLFIRHQAALMGVAGIAVISATFWIAFTIEFESWLIVNLLFGAVVVLFAANLWRFKSWTYWYVLSYWMLLLSKEDRETLKRIFDRVEAPR